MKPSILAKLASLSERLEELNLLLSSADITSNMDNYRKLTREHAAITPVVAQYRAWLQCEQDMRDAQEMLTDPEMKEFAAAEIEEGKARLEAILGEPVRLFAYPNGVPQQDYAAEHARMARDCGFTAAVSTAWGAAGAQSDRFQLPRFTPWDRQRLRFGVRLMANLRRRDIAQV